MPHAEQPLTSSASWKIALGGCLVMALAIGIGRFLLTPLLPAMMTELGLSPSDAGLVAAANYAGYLAGALIGASPLVDSRRSAVLWGSVAGSAASTALMGLDGNLPWLAAMRLIAGVLSALALVIASGIVVEKLAQAGRPGLAAMHFAGVGAGIAASAILVGVETARGAEWWQLWRDGGLVAAAFGVVAWFLLGRYEPHVPGRQSGTSLRLDRPILMLTLAYALFGYGYVITATFMVTIAREAELVHATQMTIWFIVGVTALPSVAFWTAMAKRIGVMPAYVRSTLTLAAGVMAGGLFQGLIGLAIAALLLGGTLMGITALGLVAVRQMQPDARTRAIAFVTAGFGLGQMTGPAVAGWMAEHSGLGGAAAYTLPSLSAAGLLFVSAWIAARIRTGAP
ncbi:MAG: YbfB/YjiJ family MFS transporter [Geminicoccaceae bacterium]|nr:YbfB/YjiJ family MFS transporter [Geminicoccaceae bacterium]